MIMAVILLASLSIVIYYYDVDPLQVCDSIVNIGPIADVTLGEPAFVSVSDHVIHCNVFILWHYMCMLISLNGSIILL